MVPSSKKSIQDRKITNVEKSDLRAFDIHAAVDPAFRPSAGAKPGLRLLDSQLAEGGGVAQEISGSPTYTFDFGSNAIPAQELAELLRRGHHTLLTVQQMENALDEARRVKNAAGLEISGAMETFRLMWRYAVA